MCPWPCGLNRVLFAELIEILEKFKRINYIFAVCAVGYYGPGSTCNKCTTGTYSDADGLSTCKVCGTGMTTTAIGATSSAQCGKFTFEFFLNGDEFCTEMNSVYRMSRKVKKFQLQNITSSGVGTPLPFQPCMFSRANTPFACKSETFRSSYSQAPLTLGLKGFS